MTAPAGGVDIRPCRAGEAGALLDLFRRAIRSAAARDYSAEQIAAWASDEIDPVAWAERVAATPTFVAERRGELAGFCDLEPDGHIDMLYVDAGHQRLGVAPALLRHVEAQARQAQLQRLHSEASLTARSVFERQGFVVLSPQTVSARGQAFVNFRMEKRLD